VNAVTTILKQATQIPAMPASVAKLFAMARDERSGPADVERVLKSDVSLSASLLRLANSPLVGRSRTVADLRTAVTVLGLRRVCDAAASAHLLRLVSRPLHGYSMTPLSYWKHCTAVGILSEALASHLKLEQVEMALSSGMLHDIGKLAISVACEKQKLELGVPLDLVAEQFIDAEQIAFGTDHVEVGEALCRQWHLPEEIALAARWHHAPNDCPAIHGRQIADVVHISDMMAHAFGYGTDAGGLARAVSGATCERLGLGIEHLELIASETLDSIQEAVLIFDGAGGTQ
jgi:putative nucleotidyltransferase with HDIG domain